jgi:DNA polymerase-1
MELVRQVKKDIQRKRTKDLNFAFIFGAGRGKISEMLELPRIESDQLVDAYNRMFPEVPVLLRKASELAKVRGYVRTVLGRRARFPNGERAHKSLNSVIQGSAADVMKTKLVELHRERKNTGFTLRYTVHDEVDGDVPNEESAKKVTEVLNSQSFPDLKVPILWDVQTGSNWAECK